MNRFHKAWLALTGRLEPEVREVEKRVEVEVPVIGEPHIVKLYRASIRCYYLASIPKWQDNAYLTCEQAHAECPGAVVEAFDAVLIGKHYFSAHRVQKVQPKPKRAKGRAA